MIHEYNAKRFCKEDINLIENYEEAINDKNTTWDLHHIRELTPDCDFAYSRKDLKKMNLYYQRPANELIFLRRSEHIALHNKGSNHPLYGKTRSDETRAKISEAKKGKTVSAETKQKMSDSRKKYWQNRRKKKEM